jgi:hypothetical protein
MTNGHRIVVIQSAAQEQFTTADARIKLRHLYPNS